MTDTEKSRIHPVEKRALDSGHRDVLSDLERLEDSA